MYRQQQVFAFDQETGYAETAPDSLQAHGKKNTVVSQGKMLTLSCVWRPFVPDLLVFYYFSMYHLSLFNRASFVLVLNSFK